MVELEVKNTVNRKIFLVTDIHYCHINWYGVENTDRMEMLTQSLQKHYEKDPFDCILCLGDYSLDFWCWEPYGSYLKTPSVSNTDHFMKEVFPKFPTDTYMIPGNHEQYGNEKWKEITGFDRQYLLHYGEYVFFMCDTFAGELDPTEHSDGVYSGVDVDSLKQILAKYPKKKIILCMHDLYPAKESDELKKIIRNNDQILCAFAGHTHKNDIKLLNSEWGNFPVFYCGDFSYSSGALDPEKPNWGYRILDFTKNFSTKYVLSEFAKIQ